MRLYVLALKSLVNEIVDVRVAGENTGLGSVLANKVWTIVLVVYFHRRVIIYIGFHCFTDKLYYFEINYMRYIEREERLPP